MKRAKMVIRATEAFDIISSISINEKQLQEFDSIIRDEYNIESNVKEHLDIVSFRIASVCRKARCSTDLYVKTQKILTGPKSVKLLITITDRKDDPVFDI